MKKHLFRIVNVFISLGIIVVPIFLWGGETILVSWLPAIGIGVYLESSIAEIED